MAIPFYENDEQSQQHHQSEETDQVDGPIINPPNMLPPEYQPNPSNTESFENQDFLPTEHDLMAWKILALAMCKALKDHYQQNMTTSSSSNNAVIQILPNGQVKPSWN